MSKNWRLQSHLLGQWWTVKKLLSMEETKTLPPVCGGKSQGFELKTRSPIS
ncbi:unnamed protein product [Prunus brigantina]